MRGIGGSAGIAVVSWLFVRQAQIHFNELTAHITPFNRDLLPYLAERGLTPLLAAGGAAIVHEIARQAQMLAFNDIFWFIAIVTLAIIPLLFLMKRPERGGAGAGPLRPSWNVIARPSGYYQQTLAPEVQT